MKIKLRHATRDSVRKPGTNLKRRIQSKFQNQVSSTYEVHVRGICCCCAIELTSCCACWYCSFSLSDEAESTWRMAKNSLVTREKVSHTLNANRKYLKLPLTVHLIFSMHYHDTIVYFYVRLLLLLLLCFFNLVFIFMLSMLCNWFEKIPTDLEG